jgi:hypothetical protein
MKPGRQRGMPVTVTYSLPISIMVEEWAKKIQLFAGFFYHILLQLFYCNWFC